MNYASEYADAILRRGRVPMPPLGFAPDWTDRPRKWKHYPGLESLPLPDAAPTTSGAGTVQEALFGEEGGEAAGGGFTVATLGGMLRDCYGLLGRRLAVQANTDLAALPRYTHANWHRGAASGGGLYPVTIYWIAGRGGPVLPGVHHYAPHQHALRPLLLGDVTGEVRRALGGSEEEHFLVLGVKYWQNAFKYNNFSFHAVSMDVGAATQAMRTWARAAGLQARPRIFFDERRLARLLGVDDREGIFAVLPLRWTGPRAVAPPWAGTRPPEPGQIPGVVHEDVERSRRVLDFDAVRRMQDTTRQEHSGAPGADALNRARVSPPSSGIEMPLRDPADLTQPLRTALRARRSSFGRFEARTPMPAAALATALAASARAADEVAGEDLVGHYVFVNHVDGLPPGTYRYHDGRLRQLDPTPPGEFLQANYFLENYNLEQAGAVVVPTMRTAAVIDAVGERGYRLVNATIGAIAQNFYLAATAVDLGVGVALGFDNVSYVERLGLADGEAPLLVMMLGAERPGSANFRYEIACMR
ncbi:SagB family peptide dehydrogenase [Nocardioides insulae]|uniref:SagB family peptide dehydrogenase n=1 Tax=Nocardioides insulae TaxID=394734 RepID=UPI0003F6057C|nr:SagB family peptide dehydrogenase [Nocardioides insulae]